MAYNEEQAKAQGEYLLLIRFSFKLTCCKIVF